MLQVENVTKIYTVNEKKSLFHVKTEKKKAVEKVSLNIEPGRIVGVLGVNGAGKTTLIKMLSTLLAPTSGDIIYDGAILTERNRDQIRSRINMIAGGERSLYWRLTAKENLMYFGRLYGIHPLEKRAEECLKIVDLQDAENQRVEQYSKGMKQRLQIARGIINDPDYIFLDEPTIGLDVLIARSLRQYVKQLATEQNKGIVLTTHYIQEAEELCDYIYILDHGRLIAQGKPNDLKHLYASQYSCRFRTDPAFLPAIREIAQKYAVKLSVTEDTVNMTGSEEIINQTIVAVIRADITMDELQKVNPGLEDCIVSLIEKEGKRS